MNRAFGRSGVGMLTATPVIRRVGPRIEALSGGSSSQTLAESGGPVRGLAKHQQGAKRLSKYSRHMCPDQRSLRWS
jgi:hypothetical protein